MDNTSFDNARRTVYYERRVNPPHGMNYGKNAEVDVLLPYSMLQIDGVDYIETNACIPSSFMREEGGSHVIPTYGVVVAEEWRPRNKGVQHVAAKNGLNVETPPEVMIHSFGWI